MRQSGNDTRPLILLVFANDRIAYLENIPKERQRLSHLLKPVAEQLNLEVKELDYSTVAGVIDALNIDRERLVILHFAGHSGTRLLQLDEGTVYAEGLATKLNECSQLQLVFLNGCNNVRLVKALVDVGIPNVIGTRQSIGDKTAQDFSEGFFSALAEQGLSVACAYEQACSDVQTSWGQQYRSLAINQDAASQDWAWIREFSTGGGWRLEEAANPCNRLPSLLHGGVLPAKPFKNLYYYTESDAEIFFGRCQATLDILNALDKPEPVILLHGGTGVGKSSFLKAGLIPRLLSRGQTLHYFRYSEYDPKYSLGIQIFGKDETLNVRNDLPATNSVLATVWIIDQMEEIFLQYSGDNPAHIIPDRLQELLTVLHNLLYPLDGKTKAILCIRKEWYSELEYACEQYKLDCWKYFLPPLNKQAIIEIIEAPAKVHYLYDKYRLEIENTEDNRLAEQIADDLLKDKNSNITPTLQIILSKLWQRVEKHEHRIWNEKLYLEEQKTGLLLENYLDQQVQDIADKEAWGKSAKNSGLLLDVLHSHVTPQNTAKTLHYKEYDNLYSHVDYRLPLLIALKNRYLIIEPQSDKDNDTLTKTRLAHDTIAQLIATRFAESELPGQKARRLLNEWKKNWSDRAVTGERKEPVLDSFALKMIEKGQYGTINWQQDRVESAIIQKSRKHYRYKNIYNLTALISIFVISILLIFLAIQLPDIQIENKIDDINKKYSLVSGEFKENSRNKDIAIKDSLIIMGKELEAIEDEKINKRYLIFKYEMLANLFLMRAVVKIRTTNEKTADNDHAIIYGKVLLEKINDYDAYDNKLNKQDMYYKAIYYLMHAYAIKHCQGDKTAIITVEHLKSHLSKKYLATTLTDNDTCLYEILTEDKE
ncbi:CHAT domain-containing protein [Thiothrix caldifontis]|uniref:CHAT domain-containing protein n=1 Tax=Thiothrix caldifontis TaxID=525918 RepID=A0A1H3W536_9GAMM|nr:CHAT domain-containing protein [Thiothrix caldifontis]SDZ81971.1 CHAT domain-containing protein [Thiothrix caldifontis]